MPTYQRRYFLGLLSKKHARREEEMEKIKEKGQTTGGSGKRQTKMSGEMLKTKIKSGDIPTN